ncbi:P-loop containing nucleoside triphosphate hydrolase protein [Biscogniauxia mediterranea]|nr:P-loop containing nucleoside triphosphate hydrolase protein [Biscogniauxia mediterranea]
MHAMTSTPVSKYYEEDKEPCLAVTGQSVDYNGFKFGTREELVPGPQVVLGHDALRERLLARGRRFLDLAFTDLKFMEFFIDQLSPVVWDEDCFDKLVLDPTPKRTVEAPVAMHAREGRNAPEAFDDIIRGKGKGLAMVLHGPPGVGKTLTAECAAESVHRPLYMVSAGDLGTDSIALESQLRHIMDITARWGVRNVMVTVFLRVLEYYRGILFLATNRVSTFDDAFTSRIHVPLRYTQLSEASRRKVWSNFWERIPGGMDTKNIVKSAGRMAAIENCKLNAARLEHFTKVQGDFEQDWTGFVDVNE